MQADFDKVRSAFVASVKRLEAEIAAATEVHRASRDAWQEWRAWDGRAETEPGVAEVPWSLVIRRRARADFLKKLSGKCTWAWCAAGAVHARAFPATTLHDRRYTAAWGDAVRGQVRLCLRFDGPPPRELLNDLDGFMPAEKRVPR